MRRKNVVSSNLRIYLENNKFISTGVVNDFKQSDVCAVHFMYLIKRTANTPASLKPLLTAVGKIFK